jgi:hypothetical protein
MARNGNQGFGKRKPPARTAYVAPEGLPATGKRGQNAGLDLAAIPVTPVEAPKGALSGVLFGLAIVGCLIGGYAVMMKGFGGALDQHSLTLTWRAHLAP